MESIVKIRSNENIESCICSEEIISQGYSFVDSNAYQTTQKEFFVSLDHEI